MEIPKIHEGEYRFCLILWDHEPVTAAQLAKLCLEQLGWKRTTTYTVIKRLGERGILKNENGLIAALVSKDEAQAYEIDELVEKKFEGSLPTFIAAFTKRQDLSEHELDEVQQMIDRIRRERHDERTLFKNLQYECLRKLDRRRGTGAAVVSAQSAQVVERPALGDCRGAARSSIFDRKYMESDPEHRNHQPGNHAGADPLRPDRHSGAEQRDKPGHRQLPCPRTGCKRQSAADMDFGFHGGLDCRPLRCFFCIPPSAMAGCAGGSVKLCACRAGSIRVRMCILRFCSGSSSPKSIFRITWSPAISAMSLPTSRPICAAATISGNPLGSFC